MTIVGVTASSVSGMWPFTNELWMPMAAMALHRRSRGDCCVGVAGRLADGVSREAARTELAVLMAQLDAASQRKARIVTLTGTRQIDQPGSARRVAPLALVLGGLLAILLLACSNVGNLQLARAFARRRELATRLAIGANRSRIVRQLLTETLLVSAVVSAAALALSYVLPEAILRASGGLTAMRVLPDMTVAAFTLALCLIATIVTGLVPALRGTRDAADFSAARRGPFETRRAVLRTVLLGAQVALSATLLFGATLLTRGLLHAWSIDPGYSLQTVSVVKVTLPPQAYDARALRRLSHAVARRLRRGEPRTCGNGGLRAAAAVSARLLGPPSTGCRGRRAARPPPLLLRGTVHAAEDSRRHRAPVRRPAHRRGRGQRVDGPRVLAGLDRRRSAS